MEKSDIITFLKRIDLFRDLNSSELKKLAESVREKQYTIGEYLFLENTERENIYLIHNGEVELLKREPFGNEVRLALFNDGDFPGEGIWDNGSIHSTSARTCKESRIFEISHHENLKPAAALKILSNITKVMS